MKIRLQGRIDENGLARAVEHLASSNGGAFLIPALEFLRAFGFLGSQFLLVLSPLLNLAVSAEDLEHYAAMLDNPDLFDRLVTCVERERSQS